MRRLAGRRVIPIADGPGLLAVNLLLCLDRAGTPAALLLIGMFRRSANLLLYLDAFGVALFAVEAIDKSLKVGTNVGLAGMMGLITGIGGGLLRDMLTGRPTLLVTHELYATPILLGSAAYVLLLSLSLATEVSGGWPLP